MLYQITLRTNIKLFFSFLAVEEMGYTREFIIKQVIEGLIGLVSALGNALVLYIIFKYKRLKTITNYLIASLAAADLLVGIVGIPMVIVNNFGIPRDFYGCLFGNCVIVIFTQISVFSLVGIAIERFIAVKYAIFHRQHFNSNTVRIVILICWISGAVVGSVPMFGFHSGPREIAECAFILVIDMEYMVYFNFFGFILVPLVIIFATYFYIFKVIWGRAKTVSNISSNPAENTQKVSMAKEQKAATKIFVVIVLFAVCWLPLHIMNAVSLLAGKFNADATTIGVYLSHLNSMLNPFLYAYTNPRFKEAFKKVLGFKSGGDNQSENSNNTVISVAK